MSDILNELYIACDPNKPAADDQYVDLSSVRGGNAFTKAFEREVHLATGQDGKPLTFVRSLFSGHSGSGKSSELHHLRKHLSANREERKARFLPVLMDGIEFLDDYDTDIEDILVAILAELSEQVRQHTDIDLKQTYLEKRWEELRDYLFSNVEPVEGEISISNFKAKLRLAQQSSEARIRIRNGLRPKLPTFLAEMNTAFADIRERLGKAKPKDGGPRYTDFVLIADSLDRILRAGGQTQEDVSHRIIFLEGGRQLATLDAHAIWTVPLALVRSAAGELFQVFGCDPRVLPMVKAEKRGRKHIPYPEGRAKLREVLSKRIAPHDLDDALSPEALDWMLDHCGGDVRGLMKYARAACIYLEHPPITLAAAKSGVNQTTTAFAAAIRSSYWPKLAALELSPDQQVDNNDAEFRDMLRQTWILEYINGADDGDVAPWYGVHPVIRSLKQFERVLRESETQPSKTSQSSPTPQ